MEFPQGQSEMEIPTESSDQGAEVLPGSWWKQLHIHGSSHFHIGAVDVQT